MRQALPLVSGLMLVVAGVLVYANSFQAPFLLDDCRITDDLAIRALWPPWATVRKTNRPVGMYSFAVNYALHGDRVWGYHAVNLGIHVAAGLLLYGIARRTLLQRRLAARYAKVAAPLAWVVAMAWLVHPLQTQAVTYIVQRLESLAGLFYLATLYCFVRAQGSPRGRLWQGASIVCCAFGMGTKEVMVTAPLIVLCYDRVFVAESWRDLFARRRYFYLALAATWGVLAWAMLHYTEDYTAGALVRVEGLTPWTYLMSQAGVIAHYLRLCFWPQGQCFDYDWPAAKSLSEVALPGVVILGLLMLTVWTTIRRPALGFLGAWFFLILAPTSSIMPIKDLAFEHRMYLALAAVAAVAVIAAYEGLERLSGLLSMAPSAKRCVQMVLALLVLAALGAATYARNLVYENPASLWNDVAEKAPHNARAHYNLGCICLRQGAVDKAVAEFWKALELSPGYPDVHNNLGVIATRQGTPEEAIAHFQTALEVDPDWSTARVNLANFLFDQGRRDEAMEHYRRVLRADPQTADDHINLGHFLRRQGKLREAVDHYEKALQLAPRSGEVHNSLAKVLGRLGRFEEAVAHFQKAIRAEPGNADVYFSLGNVLQRQGKDAEAIVYYQRALEIHPQSAEAHSNLVCALRAQGRIEEALAHGRKALEIRPQYVEAHCNLAMLLSSLGRFDEAIAHYRQALKIKPDFAEARGLLGRALYAGGKSREAIAEWREAIRLQPGGIEPLDLLARALATCPEGSIRDGAEAVQLAQRAAELCRGQIPEVLDTLAAAYAEANRFPDAIATANRALQLASAQGNTGLAHALGERVRLYEAGTALRESPSSPDGPTQALSGQATTK